ncbi:MAG: WG repeat-containing protein [Abditibacteriota bacterium]|nr:WG repeat-containing protein [Abditibacteriota bacterium]
MKKIFLFVFVLLIPVLLFSQDAAINVLPKEQDSKKPEIKYYKPDEKIEPYWVRMGASSTVSEDNNYIVAIKEGDDNHVKVVSKINGLTYPELDFLRPFYISNSAFNRYPHFQNIYYVGRKSGKYGAIDHQGKIVIPFIFDYNFNPAMKGDNTEPGLLDLTVYKGDTFNFIPTFDYDYFYIYDNSQTGKVIVPRKLDDYRYSVNIYDSFKTGLADKAGKVIIPCEYFFLKLINDKYIEASVFKEPDSDFLIDYMTNKISDTFSPYTKNILFKDIQATPTEKSPEEIIEDHTQKHIVREIKKGVIDYNNNIVIPTIYSNIVFLQDKYFLCYTEDKKGLLDQNGKVVIPFDYDNLKVINDKYLYVYKENIELTKSLKTGVKMYNVGVIDYNNNIVIPMDYYILDLINDQYFYATSDSGKGIIDIKNNVIIPLGYDVLEIINDKYIYAEKGGNAGIIDYNNKVIIPFDYVTNYKDGKGIYYVDDNFIVANAKGQSFVIDINNNKLHQFKARMKPFYYSYTNDKNVKEEKLFSKDYLLSAHDSYLYDLDGNNYGQFIEIKPYGIFTRNAGDLNIIDKDKNVVVIKYGGKIVSDYPNALIISDVRESNKYGLVDMKGNWIVNMEYYKIIYPTYATPPKIIIDNMPKIISLTPPKEYVTPLPEELVVKLKEIKEKSPKPLPKAEYKFIAFTNKDNTILVCLETLETIKYNKEVVGLDNEGILYVREPSEKDPRIFETVPLKTVFSKQ